MTSGESAAGVRDRVKELRRVRAGDLMANPLNFRMHPERQADVLRGVLSEIGYAAALVAREDERGNLILIDGHLRAGLDPEQQVPVLVLDVDEEEGKKLLATLDPISAMAETEEVNLATLLAQVEFESEAVNAELAKLVSQPPVEFPEVDEDVDTDFCCPKCGFRWSGSSE